jgi:DNA-binding SARP family transcriptional activator/tetratricopeptide (TPR) repeat protein
VELRILGPTEVRHDGSGVLLRGAKPRQLLVLLAMRANRPVPAEQLIEELWEGEPPPSASAALRVHVGKLRGVLELARDPNAPSGRLPLGPHGYLLRVEPDELDVQRFERLLLLAAEANANGEPATAVPRLTDALDLWRGHALADARDLSATRSEIARLEELRVVAIEELADVRLMLGEHALVIELLTAAIKDYPLRERLTESLMRALYRSGRQADALAAFRDLASRLDEGLGLEPSARLRRLEEDVLLQQSSLDFVAPRTRPGAPARGLSSVRFIGRRPELHTLTALYDEAESGHCRAALVVGPPGIGKSTLVEECCARLTLRGATPLIGSCDPDPAGDYQPLAEILRTLIDGLDPTERSQLPPVLGLVMPELVPELGPLEITGDLDAPGGRFQLFDAIAATLEQLADSPIVLVVEDLHWADRPTLALLRFLQRNPRLRNLLVIATLRDDELIGERGEIIEHLAPRGNTVTVRLDGFGAHEVRALIRSAARPETMPVIIDASDSLHDITAGNPYFLRELLRELDEEPTKLDHNGALAQTLATIAPAGVRALVDRRLDRLTDRAREVLDAAAVLGRDVTLDLLAGVCRVPHDVVFDALEESLAGRLLVEDIDDADRYLFPHTLTRNAVYASMTEDRRGRLHQRVGETLEASEAGSPRRCVDLARHFGEAARRRLEDRADGEEPGDDPDADLDGDLDRHAVVGKAADYAERAGDDAAARFAFAEAARWYGEAIRHHEDRSASGGVEYPGMGRMRLALGRALANDGKLEEARAVFAAAAGDARALGDPALLTDVALAADGPWSSNEEFRPTALPLLEEALRGIGDDDLVRRVQILNGIASDLYFVDADREEMFARDAVELAAKTDDAGAHATAQLALHRWYTHRPEARRERLKIASEACEQLARAGGPRDLQLLLARSWLSDLLENAMVTEFDRGLDAYEGAAAEFGSPRDIYWAMAMRATQATLRGDLVAGEQLARGAMLRGSELEQTSAGAHLLQRFVVRFQQGRLREELANLRYFSGGSSAFRAGAALPALAHAASGQTERACEIAWETLGPDGTDLRRDVFWLAGVAMFAGVAASAADGELLDLCQVLLEPCADHVIVFGTGAAVLGPVHYWLGVVDAVAGRVDRSIAHFREATTIGRRIEAPYWIAQSEVGAARMLRRRARRGDESEIERLERDALALARPRGYDRVIAQANATV